MRIASVLRPVLALLPALGFVGGPAARVPGAGSARTEVFRPGQVWQYHTRAGEAASRLIVLRVESYPRLGRVVHVGVYGLRMPNAARLDAMITAIPHMPFKEAALRESVTALVRACGATDGGDAGYAQWRAADGGAYTLRVDQALTVAEETLRRGRPE